MGSIEKNHLQSSINHPYKSYLDQLMIDCRWLWSQRHMFTVCFFFRDIFHISPVDILNDKGLFILTLFEDQRLRHLTNLKWSW
jgi:hypothetical protein